MARGSGTLVAEQQQWTACGKCRAIVYRTRWDRTLYVCPECGWHRPLCAHQRLEQLLDTDSGSPLDMRISDFDPLDFTDIRPYTARLEDARAATGLDEAVVCVRGTVGGLPVIVAAMDFGFMGGSLGSVVGEMITRAAETALSERTPLLIVTASGGARMQEGAIALMQMAKTSQALAQLDEAGILTVSLLTDPTFGGVAASFATLCDVLLAEPGARLGFAGRRVIEQTIRQRLPEDFQTVEFLLDRGFVDAVVPRAQLRGTLVRLLSAVRLDQGEHATGSAAATPADVVRDPGRLPQREAWTVVRQARQLDRPTTTDYISLAFDDFQELRGDRLGGDCAAIVGGLARLCGRSVVVIGHQKGHTATELNARNYAMATPAGYRKAIRLMRLGAKLGLPIVTLVDTPGAYPGMEAEERGQAMAIAESLRVMSLLPVPTVAVITSEGGSGGALALAVANHVLICSNAVYSVISPEGCAAILWQAPAAAPSAAAALRLGARDLLTLGVVDGVVTEPEGGTGANPMLAADRLRAAVLASLAELSGLSPTELIAERWRRFRQFGAEYDPEAGLASVNDGTVR